MIKSMKYFRHSLTLLFENFSKMNLYEQRDHINEQICKLIEEREKDLVFGADENSGSAPHSLDDLRGELDEAKQYLESAKNSLRILAEIYQQRTEDAQEISISDRREKFEEMKRDYAEKITTMGRLEAEVRRVDGQGAERQEELHGSASGGDPPGQGGQWPGEHQPVAGGVSWST